MDDRSQEHGLMKRLRLTRPHRRHPLDEGLAMIGQRLGLNPADTEYRHTRVATACTVQKTEDLARPVFYAPDMDGGADPGEVVWILIHPKGSDLPAVERAIVVVGRTRQTLLGLLISPSPEHDREDNWLDIGAGSWDDSGQQCWVRMDKVLEVPESEIRRQGAVIPHRRFERISSRLRANYGWG